MSTEHHNIITQEREGEPMDEGLVRIQVQLTADQLAQVQRIVYERKSSGDRTASQAGIIREALDKWLKGQGKG